MLNLLCKLFIPIVSCLIFASCSSSNNLTIKGETNYFESGDKKTLSTSFSTDYKLLIVNLKNKTPIYFFGSISPDYDHFGNLIKLNGFNGISIEF